MMKLQDYLHYYLGAKISKDSDALDYPIIKGFHGDRVMISEYRYKTPNCDKVFTRPEMYHYVEFIKPILRRLADMTEDEAIGLVGLVVYEDEYISITTYRHNLTNDLMVSWGLGISNEVTDYFNATGERSWSAAQFNYLLTHHFDLFNLIDAGLAIDAKTIKS